MKCLQLTLKLHIKSCAARGRRTVSSSRSNDMIVAWPIYAQFVVLSCFCPLGGRGCQEAGQQTPPAGYKFMLMSDVRKNYKPNTFVIMSYSDALAQGKVPGASGSGARRTNSRALPADEEDDGHGGRRRRTFFASGDADHGRPDGGRGDVWRDDVTVAAVVVDPGRRVRVFAGDDDGDVDRTVAAVDARVVDAETAADVAAEAEEDDVVAIAALYFPVVDKLARQIVPGIRRQQVLSLALIAGRATMAAVERMAAAARHVPSKPVKELDNYASSIYDNAWKNILPYNYKYIQSLSNPKISNYLEQQSDYEDDNDDADHNDGNDDVVDGDDDNDDYDCDDEEEDDDDDDMDYNDDTSYKVNKSDNREVCVDTISSDNGNSDTSKLDEIVKSKKISDVNNSIQLNFIKDMSGKQLVQYVNSLNIKQEEPIVENQKLFINLMKFEENVSDKDIQQLITTITNASNLFIASALSQYTANQ